MKLREFLNTNQQTLEGVYIYFEDLQWENDEPEYTARDMKEISNADLNAFVDAWYMDANFWVHVLLS